MYEVYTDGASKGDPGWAGAGIFIKNNGEVKRYSFPLGMKDTHEAEFIAVIKALEILSELEADTISLRSDSQTVVQAIEKEYIHKQSYKPLLEQILTLSKQFPLFFVKWVPSKENKADALARQAIQLNEET
ncbi:ribonuclease HI [Bacillus ectoiniformans]|uniref:ribonuclease HI family protein n=1 Tax=Bacillus ectoiniformans TaxID=1494429 RepID=UPI001959ACC9|nr:ribonuclease HI family protein [Bacillus ectoiniformans]MBM7647927.1 ribonuclease HI [Bacillus ectoiniformans]